MHTAALSQQLQPPWVLLTRGLFPHPFVLQLTGNKAAALVLQHMAQAWALCRRSAVLQSYLQACHTQCSGSRQKRQPSLLRMSRGHTQCSSCRQERWASLQRMSRGHSHGSSHQKQHTPLHCTLTTPLLHALGPLSPPHLLKPACPTHTTTLICLPLLLTHLQSSLPTSLMPLPAIHHLPISTLVHGTQ